MENTKNINKRGRVLTGIVVSNKMKDTIVVSVERYKKHPRYGKYVKNRQRFKVHDAGNTKQIGDRVKIIETRPISKDKHFTLVSSD